FLTLIFLAWFFSEMLAVPQVQKHLFEKIVNASYYCSLISANALFHDSVLLSHRSLLPKYLLQIFKKMYCTIVLNDIFQSTTVTLALHLQKHPIFSYSPFSRGWAKTPNF
ncbi:hypothetical protein OB980_20725, partial [Bacillus cereus]|nr:hypothetical protein [Bacillus cereus]